MPTITVEDIINENYTEDDIKIDIGRKYATISKLLKVDEKNMPKVRKFVKKLGAEFVKNFDVQWIKRKWRKSNANTRRNIKIRENLKDEEEKEENNIVKIETIKNFLKLEKSSQIFEESNKKIMKEYTEYNIKKEEKDDRGK